ncbi:MAG: hypothetical protein P8Y44_01835 [Acidobacteriota bacterium]
MKTRRLLYLILPLLVTGAVLADMTEPLWLHVRVDDSEGSKVRVNLPMSMAQSAVAMFPDAQLHQGRVMVHDREFSIQELRQLWAEIQATPDMTFITVEKQSEGVKIWKEQGKLRIEARGPGDDKVDVRVPVEVVNALLSGDEDELDIGAAIAELAESGAGEIVAVSDARDNVRIWVDSIAEID